VNEDRRLDFNRWAGCRFGRIICPAVEQDAVGFQRGFDVI